MLLDKLKNFIKEYVVGKNDYKLEVAEENDVSKDVDEIPTYEDLLLEKYGGCKEEKKFGLKIIFVTDTHNCLMYDKDAINLIKTAEYDCCILLGDHTANDLYEIKQIVPAEKLYGILGNHDMWEKYEEYGIRNIHGDVIEVKGVKIAALGGAYKYKDSDKYVLYSHEESVATAEQMPEADILISHDRAFTESRQDEAHDGLKGITEYIYKNHVRLHIHGHLHEELEEELKNGTKSICLFKVKLMEV